MSRLHRHLSLILSIGVALPLQAQSTQLQKPAAHAIGATAQKPKPIDRANLDTTCAACTDFFTFANGGWLKHTTIPAAYSSIGTLRQLSDGNLDILHRILDSLSQGSRAGTVKPGTDAYRLAAYYEACRDTATIERLGLEPLAAQLRTIDQMATSADVAHAFASLEYSDGLAPFGLTSSPDVKNSNETIVAARQGGLSLPDREYYLNQDPTSTKLRAAFLVHVARMFLLLGDSAAVAEANAKTVLALETDFATAWMDNVTRRDPNATYYPMSLSAFEAAYPNLHWADYLSIQHGPAITTVNVAQPAFFKALDSLVATVPVADWKTLMRWRLVSARAPALPRRIALEDFQFNTYKTGAKEQLPRWQTCTTAADHAMGDALGQMYVAGNFSPAAKARATEIVDNLVSVLREQIGQLDWMDSATKAQALVKLDAVRKKIGYPDAWRDYHTADVHADRVIENDRSLRAISIARDWAKVGKPVDHSEWGMTPPTVNAAYSPSTNEIVFPAGILQAPIFDADADDAVNYGAMGAVIGHEMTHGYDNTGRQFDARGNLRDWWTKDDAAKFNAEAVKVVNQFNSYTIVDSLTHVNGRLTLGENIADLGGLKIAYLAMERSFAKKGRPGPIDGFTPEQRFFLGWAQVWRSLQRDQSAKLQVATDPHAPALWRVNGPLSNMPEFKLAWGCKAGDAMVRPDNLRAQIW